MSRSRSVTVGLISVTILAILMDIGCATAGFSADVFINPAGAKSQESASTYGTAQLVQAAPAAASQPLAGSSAPQEAAPVPSTASPSMQVTLTAARTTISWDGRDPDQRRFELPLLFLHQQREAAPAKDRTLVVSVVGVAAGTEIELEAISRHVDTTTGAQHTLTTRVVLPEHSCTADIPCTVPWTLDAATTLSDFYTLRLKDTTGNVLWSNPDPERPDFVALDTWDAEIGDYVVRVYYATLFPFARSELDLQNRLAHSAVTDFVEYVFVPMILDTWHTQLVEWGFGDPIQPDWDQDMIVEIIVTYPPFALFDGIGPYTLFVDRQGNPYPERRIWWRSTVDNFHSYDLLPNGYKVIFAHEFFHLSQWNVLLSTGRPTNYWLMSFIEAQGRFASSVQYPEIEIGERHVARDISEERVANRFLTQRLNRSYRELEVETVHKYDLGLYWRFLYEQYNDMRVIRAALEEMARHREPDIVTSMPEVMDRAFERLDGPFHNFEESLVAFARTNYALRLENGRCAAADLAACGGHYYDPKGVYVDPPLEAELYFESAAQTYSGTIPTSYGMDFVEVILDDSSPRRPIKVTFQSEGSVARFHVQIWELGAGRSGPRALTPSPETILRNSTEEDAYAILYPDQPQCDRLALVITRLDPGEAAEPVGNYRITLDSATRADYDQGTVVAKVTARDGSIEY